MKLLIAGGEVLNIQDPLTGETPLRLAAGLNRFSVAKCLLEAGADPNQGNALNSTPLHVAVGALQDKAGKQRPVNLRLAALLLSYGADAQVRDAEGRKAVDLAAEPERFLALVAKELNKRLPAARVEPCEKSRF